MNLPCINCAFKIVRKDGHRSFYGCSDRERKEKYFKEDDFFYDHKCSGYVEENTPEGDLAIQGAHQ